MKTTVNQRDHRKYATSWCKICCWRTVYMRKDGTIVFAYELLPPFDCGKDVH